MIGFYEIGEEIDMEDESYIIFYHNPIEVKSTLMLSNIEELEQKYPILNVYIVEDYSFEEYGVKEAPYIKIYCCGKELFKAHGIVPLNILEEKIKPIISIV